METRAHHIVIGVFTLVIICAGLFFSLWLTKSSTDREFKLYDIVFNEAVTGLSQGSMVQYSGIRVGEVTQLRLDPDNASKVWARIRVSATTPIRQDTQARLAVAGITGIANIQLSSGRPTAPLLEETDGNIPVIIATPSSLNQLLTNSGDLMTNANQLLIRLNSVLADDNLERFNRTLDNLEKFTGTVAGERENIHLMLQQVTLTLTQANKLIGNANRLIQGPGSQLVNDTAKTMASLEKSSAIISQLLADNQTSLNNGMQGLDQLGPAIEELRRTLSTLRSSINRLEENPSALLRGRERTQEFQPQ